MSIWHARTSKSLQHWWTSSTTALLAMSQQPHSGKSVQSYPMCLQPISQPRTWWECSHRLTGPCAQHFCLWKSATQILDLSVTLNSFSFTWTIVPCLDCNSYTYLEYSEKSLSDNYFNQKLIKLLILWSRYHYLHLTDGATETQRV